MSKKNQHNKNLGSEIIRSDDRIGMTGEIFTPAKLCAEMVSQIPESILQNDKSTFIDNSAGSGNFLLALQTELLKYHSLLLLLLKSYMLLLTSLILLLKSNTCY